MRGLDSRLLASTPQSSLRWALAASAYQIPPNAPRRASWKPLKRRPRPHSQLQAFVSQQPLRLAACFSTTRVPLNRPPSVDHPDEALPKSEPKPIIPLDNDGRLSSSAFPKLPFRFATGIALYAKRQPRPFPPPFLSPPSGSFSDALSTHDRSRDRRAFVDGQLIQGYTNGDDAVFASNYFVCANDGVGAWSTRPRGHAGLWSRLILHYWATAIFEDAARQGENYRPDPIAYLQRAYEQTIEATSAPNDWQGTTTAAGAQLHYRRLGGGDGNGKGESPGDDISSKARDGTVEPLLYVTNLGDSQIMVVRPSTRELVFKSTEQWHWFDCPRQLGTNSPDTPATCAVVDAVAIREGDIVLAMSDGVIDNLWAHEIVEKVSESLDQWKSGQVTGEVTDTTAVEEGVVADDGGASFIAKELMETAKTIALDPFAESPFMEHAIEEGLASAGGKPDDISVVVALCQKNEAWAP